MKVNWSVVSLFPVTAGAGFGQGTHHHIFILWSVLGFFGQAIIENLVDEFTKSETSIILGLEDNNLLDVTTCKNEISKEINIYIKELQNDQDNHISKLLFVI